MNIPPGDYNIIFLSGKLTSTSKTIKIEETYTVTGVGTMTRYIEIERTTGGGSSSMMAEAALQLGKHPVG
jgi:hypothetical protein